MKRGVVKKKNSVLKKHCDVIVWPHFETFCKVLKWAIDVVELMKSLIEIYFSSNACKCIRSFGFIANEPRSIESLNGAFDLL